MSERATTKHDIQRDELNITRPNFSDITQLNVSGTFVNLQFTGVDRGTGLVTITTSGTPAILDVNNTFTAPIQTIFFTGSPQPTFRVNKSQNQDSYFDFTQFNDGVGQINKVTASGTSTVDINPQPLDLAPTSVSSFRIFRSTVVNASATATLGIFSAEPISRLTAQISANKNSNTYFSTENNFGVGLASPLVRSHHRDDTTTNNAVLEVMRVEAIVTGTSAAANGFGVGQTFYAETATNGTSQLQGKVETDWTDSTNASRKGEMKFYASDSGGDRLGMTIGANGSQAILGLYNATPITRGVVTGSRAANAALTSLLVVLNNLGAITNSSSA